MKVFKPNTYLYIILLLLSLLILSTFIISSESSWNIVLSGIGCGGVASVVVAWLIDNANCKKQNNALGIYKEYLFSDYRLCLIMFFQMIAKNVCSLIPDKENESNTWKEWLVSCQDIFLKENKSEREDNFCKHLCTYISSIKKSYEALKGSDAVYITVGVLTLQEVKNIRTLTTKIGKLDEALNGWSPIFELFFSRYINEIEELIESIDKLSNINHIEFSYNDDEKVFD